MEIERYNEDFIHILGDLATVMNKRGEQFRAKAYQKAQESIISYPQNITDVSQLSSISGVGKSIVEKLGEFVTTGKIALLEQERVNPANILCDVYGIGPKKAGELVATGIQSIADLERVKNDVLNDVQRVGLKYYYDIIQRIPRSEIETYETLFRNVVENYPSLQFEIVGSYRRGAQNSGDIDVILTSTSASNYKKFVDELIKRQIIVEVLSRGQSKTLVITKLNSQSVARRVDFLFSPPDEYAFSILYFTGSKIFNTIMRQHALSMGLTLNEHGFHSMTDGKKGEKIELHFASELDIFNYLNLAYKEPMERIDGRSIVSTQQRQQTVQQPTQKKSAKANTKPPANPVETNTVTDFTTFPTLYNTTIGTGREKQWAVQVLDNGNNTYTVKTEYGIVGGKQTTHESLVAEGKNTGKKNETTPRQQAQLEAERDWVKKQKQGYLVRSCDQLCATVVNTPDQLGDQQPTKKMLKPMLALEFDMSKPCKFPVYIQPKLDGVRCLIYKMNGQITFQSRQNTIYAEFAHLAPQLTDLFNRFRDQEDLVLDGELYTHGLPFEKITSLVRSSKRKAGEIELLNYHVYDCFYSSTNTENNPKNTLDYQARQSVLLEAFGANFYPNLVLVETQIASDKDAIERYHEYYTTMENAYEGVMVRSVKGVYKQQGRSKDLQKYKKFFDEEFEIVGHHEGTGAHAGTAIFDCRSNVNKNKLFGVTMQGTLESKRQMVGNITDYYGKMLTVKYQEKSEEGIPRFPVGIGFRDYE